MELPLQRCETCRYWEQHVQSDSGECRRFPPVIIEAQITRGTTITDDYCGLFPDTHKLTWCGEWGESKQVAGEVKSLFNTFLSGLSGRAKKAIYFRAKANTYEKMAMMRKRDIWELKNAGYKTVIEIHDRFSAVYGKPPDNWENSENDYWYSKEWQPGDD